MKAHCLPSRRAILQILSGLQQQLQNEQDALNTAKQQRVYLQSLIEQYRSVHGTTRTVDGFRQAWRRLTRNSHN
jgi:succinoglycan biosynthesis transport protein ExoP